MKKHLVDVHHLRLVPVQRQHDDAEGILQLGVLVQLVQDHIGVGVPAQFDVDAHAFPAGFIRNAGNAFDPLVADQLRHLLDQSGLVYHVGKLCHDDAALPVRHGLYIGDRAHPQFSAARAVGFFDAPFSKDHGTRREVRSLDNFKNLFDGGVSVLFHTVVDDLHHRADHLAKVVGRNVGRHSDGDSLRTVHQQVRVAGRKDCRLFFRLVKVRDKVHRILVDVRQHLHGDLGKSGFRITHGGSSVAVHASEVSVSVHQRITGGPFLCHVDQGTVNGAVSVGMIFTHGIADDTGAFSVRLVRPVVQLYHGIEHTPLHRLQAVPDIRKGSGGYDAHGIVYVRVFHCFFQVHVMDLIKDFIVHYKIPLLV